MDKTNRLAPPPDDRRPVEAIEIAFSMPVYLTEQQEGRLVSLLSEIIDSPCNQPAEGVHWLAGCGAKPRWPAADAAEEGRAVPQEAPESGEPTFDESCLFFETAARPFVSEKERERVTRRRAANKRDGH